MEINYTIVGIVVAICIVIVVIAIIRNQKEKKKLERHLNDNYLQDEEFDADLNDEKN